ncbi:NAD(P)-dependent dehydrogenase (short-subunit alcohol dehydrogenase family) [Amycolatopsis bartoniae]|nr:SDR family oxidoreductase [Amycolatopsis bartoniae]MBB2940260.1 NAD(P)-dependent dehydrogenase (short-subunit alcohol dehydrogenase family) [Amycolatopsis bartoniae]TVT10161.1 SDR family oxidoreductase [Amycolatopsis bartoniae]
MAAMTLDDLGGRVALVTGGSRGLGLNHARRLAEAGARVVVTDLTLESGMDSVPGVRAVPMDIRDTAAVRDLIADIVAHEGGLDIVVNNAGGASGYVDPGQDPVVAFRAVVELNVVATYAVCLAAAPVLPDGGRLILTSSSSAFRHTFDVPASYVAAKLGVVGLTRALARDLGEAGIAVNAVAPGFTPHEEMRKRIPERVESMTSAAVRDQRLKRPGTPDDISSAVLFLAGPGAGFMTGQVLLVDGGWTFV